MSTAAATAPSTPGSAVIRLMEEARRRFESFGTRYGKTLAEAWIGLGTPSEYRPALEGGWMVALRGGATPRVPNWFLLTEAGLDLYRSLYPGSETGSHRIYRDGSIVHPYSLGDENARARILPLVEWIVARGARGFTMVEPDGKAHSVDGCDLHSASIPIDGYDGQYRIEHSVRLSDGDVASVEQIPLPATGDGAEIMFDFSASHVGLTMRIDGIWNIEPHEDGSIGFELSQKPYRLLPRYSANG